MARDPLSLQLVDPRRRRIEQSLSLNDIFSFDVVGHSGLRSNLESAFGRYEQALAGIRPSCFARLEPAASWKRGLS